MTDMKKLIGKHVIGISKDADNDCLVFECLDGEYVFEAVGDCCSQSWFESFSDVDAILGATIADVEIVSNGVIEHPDHECLQSDFIKFKTNKGHATIDFRNSSNGYYGGWAEFRETKPAGTFEPVTKDFPE